MSIFQKSVLKTEKQNDKIIAVRWAEYQKYLEKKDFIEDVKEEKYQEGFLRDIFENCLGYTLDSSNPKDFNLEREKKNETDSKKADGVIYVDDKIVGVIELKGQDTQDLDKAETQAFGYLVSHSLARYVIVSNFDELRFYVDKKTSYEEFSLFHLDYEEFRKLHLLISYESIQKNTPLKLKEKSLTFEKEISKNLYRDFSLFRTNLFENLIKNNDQAPSSLLRLTQKLCDRIIFILFAEDRGYLNANTIKEIREEFASQKFTEYALYDIYKFYFNAINEGSEKLNISKYNGGLFAKDSLLDNLVIDDHILDMQAQALSDYDFMSDVSVNILGHIFEQSLTDLEEMNARINDEKFDSHKSKRKKDGVFYTPEYITEYLIENTLGKLCKDKKTQLELINLTPPKNPKRPTKKEQTLKKNLELYREWLLNLKILDPACGSGAFLNQALEFLIKEHRYLQKALVIMGDIMAYHEIEKSILENNLYGVDINEDAVEIAKLSLWLRTASKDRELTKLADKIKCGNSLIDNSEVAQDAFIWEDEFPNVFEEGGFDIIIGNPPYGAKLAKEHQDFLKDRYNVGSSETAILFIKLSFDILHSNGLLGFIIPKSFSFSSNYKQIRSYVWENLTALIDCKKVWKEVKLEQVMIVVNKQNESTEYNSGILKNQDIIDLGSIKKNDSNLFGFFLNGISSREIDVAKKMLESSIFLNDVAENQRGYGLQQYIKDEGELKVLGGADIDRYHVRSFKGKISKADVVREQSHIRKNSVLVQNLVSHIENPTDHIKIIAAIPTDTTDIIIDTINQISIQEGYSQEYIWILLNSKLLNWYVYRFIYGKAIRTMHFDSPITSRLPIKPINTEEQKAFIQKATIVIELNSQLQSSKQNFIKELNLEKVPKKLQNFHVLTFEEFAKEYKKATKLKFQDKLEERNFKNLWRSLFEHDSKIAKELELQKDVINNEINTMVYRLYKLNDNEISLVENE